MLHIVLSTDSLSLPRPWQQKDPTLEPEKFTRFHHTYPYLLEKRLAAIHPGNEVRVTNFATRASSLAASWSHRLELFSWMGAAVGVLHKGVVDCWPRGEGVGAPITSLDKFREAYHRLLDERAALAPRQPFVVIGIAGTNAAMRTKNPTIPDAIAAYNAVLRERHDDRMRFIDMEQAVRDQGEHLLHPDGHHLVAAGHAYLTARLADAIEDLLGAAPTEAALTRASRA